MQFAAEVQQHQPLFSQPAVPEPWMGTYGDKLPVLPGQSHEPCVPVCTMPTQQFFVAEANLHRNAVLVIWAETLAAVIMLYMLFWPGCKGHAYYFKTRCCMPCVFASKKVRYQTI
jgi:hypothetical protein